MDIIIEIAALLKIVFCCVTNLTVLQSPCIEFDSFARGLYKTSKERLV